jgi:GDP-mannose 6-dehydrogenase
VSIYDDNVRLATLTGKNREYVENRIPLLSNLMSDNLQELLDNSEIIVLNNREEKFLTALKNVSGKTIIDMIHIDDETVINKNQYKGINW